MLKSFFFLFTLLSSHLIFGQSVGMFTTNYHIEVKFSDLKNQKVILAHHFGEKQYTVDSTEINNNGVALFKGSETDTLRYGVYLIYVPQVKYFDILVNEPKVVLSTSIADPVGDMEAISSKENQLFYSYLQFLEKAKKRAGILQKEAEGDAKKAEEVQAQRARLDKEVKQFIEAFIQDNKGTFAAQTVTVNKQVEIPSAPSNLSEKELKKFRYEFYYKHFWDYTDLSDERLLYSPWIQARINNYLTKLTYQYPDSINKAADRLVAMTKGNRAMYRYIVNYITNLYESSKLMSSESVFVHMVNNYYSTDKAWWVDDAVMYKIKQRATTLKNLLIGKKLPDCTLIDVNGKPVNINGNKDEYTVLFFYDPTCGHCKKDAPKMEEVRKNFVDKGVRFLGVALDIENSNEGIKKWREFIADKGMQDWINISDLDEKNYLLARYDIRSTPYIYVLDKEKNIVLKRLGAEQLGKVLGDFIDSDKQ